MLHSATQAPLTQDNVRVFAVLVGQGKKAHNNLFCSRFNNTGYDQPKYPASPRATMCSPYATSR